MNVVRNEFISGEQIADHAEGFERSVIIELLIIQLYD